MWGQISRRQFIKGAVAGLAGSLLPSSSFGRVAFERSNWLVTTNELVKRSYPYQISEETPAHPTMVTFCNLQSFRKREQTLSFRPHEVAQNPVHPTEMFALQKWGRTAAFMRWQSGRCSVSNLSSGKDCRFFGHACYSQDGQWIYVAEMNDARDQGEISVRRTDTGKVEERFWSGGIYPHQLSFDRGRPERLLVVNAGRTMKAWASPSGWGTSFGARPSLIWMDSKTGHIDQGYGIEEFDHAASHFAQNERGEILIVSDPKPFRNRRVLGLLKLIDGKGRVQEIDVPATLSVHGENLSVEWDVHRQRFLVVNTGRDFLMSVDPEKKRIDRSFRLPGDPKGVAVGKEGRVWVSLGKSRVVRLFEEQSLESWSDIPGIGGNGAHIYLFRDFMV